MKPPPFDSPPITGKPARRRFRAAEWIVIAYFAYVAVLSALFDLRNPSDRLRALLLFATVVIVYTVAAFASSRSGRGGFEIFRDWVTLVFTIAAYRAMDWFTPVRHTHLFERIWIVWDRTLLGALHGRAIIESAGAVIPSILEFCYLIVYGIGPFALAVLYVMNVRERAPRLLFLYETGTLLAYAFFPFFPSEPPRTAFAGLDLPTVGTWFRSANLGVVNGYGIHSSVFPSAHVSSAFAAAFAMILLVREKPWFGRGMLIYAVLVAIAVIYGRYHYAIDSLAGLVVSLVALACYRAVYGSSGAWPN